MVAEDMEVRKKGNRAQDIYDLYSGDIPGLQGAYVYDYNEDTSWGAAYDPAVKYVTPLSLDETSDYYGKPATWQHGLDLRVFYSDWCNQYNQRFVFKECERFLIPVFLSP